MISISQKRHQTIASMSNFDFTGSAVTPCDSVFDCIQGGFAINAIYKIPSI